MKKITALFIVFTIFMNIPVSAAKIFTAPIDSRPVSATYLERLANISGDTCVCIDPDTLDFFSGKGEGDHIGDSPAVREQIYQAASENNTADSTFIINMTSYLTGGLVGSRSAVNYKDSAAALSDLEKLMTDFQNPNYYINLSMPRTLPDSRFGAFWTDNKTYEGLGSFYLKANPQSPLKAEIAAKYAHVTPAQLLLEWAYVKNHKAMGELTSWEDNFLKYFTNNYETKDPYRQYLNSYRATYSKIAEIGSKLMKLKKKGLDFELIISEDDFQLPDFITYLNETDFLNDETKYSFALNYMETTLYGEAKAAYGKAELEKALTGRGERINFIFGADEIPQLIYARDLSKRTGIIPNLTAKGASTDKTAKFDVKAPKELMTSAINFVSAGKRRSREQTHIYLFDYSENASFKPFLNQMETDSQTNNIALIELYTTAQTATGENHLFNLLLEKSLAGDKFGLHSLAAYSSWNTHANAIGLGVAHAAVYSIVKETDGGKRFTKANLEMLTTHIMEDAVYNCQIKRQLYGYYPYYDENNAAKLQALFDESGALKAFYGKEYDTAEGSFTTEKAEITDRSFPWLRTFECYIKTEITETNQK